MKEFHFSKKYFKTMLFDDSISKVRIVIKEVPSIDISEEEYSLSISTRYEDKSTIHRYYAIEHHLPPSKHAFPIFNLNSIVKK